MSASSCTCRAFVALAVLAAATPCALAQEQATALLDYDAACGHLDPLRIPERLIVRASIAREGEEFVGRLDLDDRRWIFRARTCDEVTRSFERTIADLEGTSADMHEAPPRASASVSIDERARADDVNVGVGARPSGSHSDPPGEACDEDFLVSLFPTPLHMRHPVFGEWSCSARLCERQLRHGGPFLALGAIAAYAGPPAFFDPALPIEFLLRAGYEIGITEYVIVSLEIASDFESIYEGAVVELGSPAMPACPGIGAGIGIVARELGERDADAAVRLRLTANHYFVGATLDFDYWPSIDAWTSTLVGRVSL